MEMPYGIPPGFEFPPGALAPAPAIAANAPLMSLPPSFPQQDGPPPHFPFPGYPPLHATPAPGLPLPVAGAPSVATPHPLPGAGGEAEGGAKQQSIHASLGSGVGGPRPREEREGREGGRQEGRRREAERERPVGPEGARNLYIHNVPRDASEDDVRQFFSKCGEVESVFLRVNQKIGPNAVYAFVLYKHPDDARKCFDTMNGAQFGGRSIRVEYQRGRRGGAGGQDSQHPGGRDNESNAHNSRNSDDHQRPSDHFPSRDGQGRNIRERERERGGRGGGDSGRWRPTSGRSGGGDRDDSRRSLEPRGGRGGDRGGGGPNRDEDGRDGRYGDDHGRRGGRGRGGDRGSRERNTSQSSGTWARQPLHLTALLQERKPHLRIPSLPGNKGFAASSFPAVPASTPAAPAGPPGGVRTAETPQVPERLPANQQSAPTPAMPTANAAAVSAVGSSWAWTLGRNDKRRVQVVASLVRGEVPSSLVHLTGLLNVSHRSKWEEVAAKTIHAVVTLEAAHPDQQAALDEYISYFTSKERAGVANVGTHYIYLVPPNCSLFARYQGLLPARFQQSSNFLLALAGPQYSTASVPASAPPPAEAAPAANTSTSLPSAADFAGSYAGNLGATPAGAAGLTALPSSTQQVPAHQQMVVPSASAGFSAPQQQPASSASGAPAGLCAAGAGASPASGGLGSATTANWMQQLSTMAAFLGGRK
ncbi:SPOC domain-containing protein [Toxoplasma gondii VAND]|uniref:SPOC domain-containing protein n=1 Tax=Toxoplasma gondii VAND TaxID=933077 RepID=A0A086QLE8_TOXGO|nr:SPOC domain-containing protein [Toxoplasma gondii VAND]